MSIPARMIEAWAAPTKLGRIAAELLGNAARRTLDNRWRTVLELLTRWGWHRLSGCHGGSADNCCYYGSCWRGVRTVGVVHIAEESMLCAVFKLA